MNTITQKSIRQTGSKSRVALELGAIASLFLINEFLLSGINYASQLTLILSLLLITYLLKRRDSNWLSLGLKLPQSWLKAIILWILCVATIGLTFNFIVQPLFPHGANEINQGMAISFNQMLFQLLVIGIGTAAIGEELLFRGYLLNAINELLGQGWMGNIAAIFIQAFIFGILHSGVQGMVSAGVIGVILGVFYLWSNRNLLVVMAAHAVPDILSIIGSYQQQ